VNIDGLLLVLFTSVVLLSTYRMARRDALYAGFLLFFFAYTIFAMVGYRFYPLLSQVLNAYFGVRVYHEYFAFVCGSFFAFIVSTHTLHGKLVGTTTYDVSYHSRAIVKWVGLVLAAALVVWMGATLWVIYERISYTGTPQIPLFFFAFFFKNSIFILLLLWAFSRRYARSALEYASGWSLVLLYATLFLLTALKSENRTDILALLLGVTWYELSPLLLDRHWRLRFIWNRSLARVLVVFAVATVFGILGMELIRTGRDTNYAGAIPVYASILLNDYYAPAHILFASLEYEYVRPVLVLKSNIANGLLLGGLLDVPYLQTEVGNRLLPGTSSRSTGFAFYIFTEGYMAAGPWLGVIYNGIVPVVLIALWRRLGRTTDVYYNAFVGALCAMSFATVARSGNFLFLRVYLFALLPTLLIFRTIVGARLVTSSEQRDAGRGESKLSTGHL
jgi:hypothetical protein